MHSVDEQWISMACSAGHASVFSGAGLPSTSSRTNPNPGQSSMFSWLNPCGQPLWNVSVVSFALRYGRWCLYITLRRGWRTRGRWTLWSLQKWWWGTLFLDVSLWQGTGSSKLNPSWHWQPGLQRFIFCWWNPTRWGPLTIYICIYTLLMML